jgi:hypothetical protein
MSDLSAMWFMKRATITLPFPQWRMCTRDVLVGCRREVLQRWSLFPAAQSVEIFEVGDGRRITK